MNLNIDNGNNILPSPHKSDIGTFSQHTFRICNILLQQQQQSFNPKIMGLVMDPQQIN